MTKQQAREAMKDGQKVTHNYFSDNEWAMMGADEEGNNVIITEDNCVIDEDIFWELRAIPQWQTGWKLYTEPLTPPHQPK